MKIAGKDNPHRIIWKPFKSESLLRMIDNVLNGSEKSAALRAKIAETTPLALITE
jgi:hypothetical protein